MHWLKEFRRNYQRKDGSTGITRREFAAMVRKRDTEAHPEQEIGCSEVLIAMLEELPPDKGGVTHPAIADRIADITGATPQQRDMLVNPIHRGSYKPRPAKPHGPKQPGGNADESSSKTRAVVQIAISGSEIARFPSESAAAKAAGCCRATVCNRVKRDIGNKTNEFATYGYTWRFADEWDAMTIEERLRDMYAAGMCK